MGPMGADYGQMSAWLDRQQRRIHELEAENRELRLQLDELRRGVGVAVMIQGHVVPLAPLATAQQAPSAASGPAHMPAAPLSQSPAPAGRPAAPPSQEHAPAAFAEDAWLTGSMRAVKASPRRPERASPRPQTPSQEITPLWLREETPPATTERPREPATWDEILAAQTERAWPSTPQHQHQH